MWLQRISGIRRSLRDDDDSLFVRQVLCITKTPAGGRKYKLGAPGAIGAKMASKHFLFDGCHSKMHLQKVKSFSSSFQDLIPITIHSTLAAHEAIHTLFAILSDPNVICITSCSLCSWFVGRLKNGISGL